MDKFVMDKFDLTKVREASAILAGADKEQVAFIMGKMKEMFPDATREEEEALAAAFKAGDTRAGQRLVEANIPKLILTAARYWKVNPEVMEEVVQNAVIDMMDALSTFDETRGVLFFTYASSAVRKRLFRPLKLAAKALHIDRSKATEAITDTKWDRVAWFNKFAEDNGEAPTPEEEAAAFGLEPGALRYYEEKSDLSADTRSRVDEEDNEQSLADTLPAATLSPEDALEEKERQAKMRGLLVGMARELVGFERVWFESRLITTPPRLSDLAKAHGVTLTAAENARRRALAKLRKAGGPMAGVADALLDE